MPTFAAHLAKIAGDGDARAARVATRERLITRMPEIAREERNVTNAIAAVGDLEPLVARVQALKAGAVINASARAVRSGPEIRGLFISLRDPAHTLGVAKGAALIW